MTAHYKLKYESADFDVNLQLPRLVEIDECTDDDKDCPVIEVITAKDFKDMEIFKGNENYSPIAFIDSESNFCDFYPECIVGSFSVPPKTEELSDPYNFSFFMDKNYLIFIDTTSYVENLLNELSQSGMMNDVTTAHILFLIFKMMLMHDLDYLSDLEDKMEDLEEMMLVKDEDVSNDSLMNFRRLSMRLSSFYQQITTMATMLSENDNQMMTKQESRSFLHVANLGDRLTSRAETLKEYSLQLHEMNQTRIDLQQNQIMQVLTIVTVILAPLTLITGWFGMNLNILPGLDISFLWIVLIMVGVLFVVISLLFFHRKKWL